jgi:hypothetical protein
MVSPRRSPSAQQASLYHTSKFAIDPAVGVQLGDYTLKARLTLQAYAQAVITAGHFSDFQSADAPSAGRVIRFADLRPVAPPPVNPDFDQGALDGNAVPRWNIGLVRYSLRPN